ncbi:MAG: EXLDI protein [Ktedonobacterales bacterium]
MPNKTIYVADADLAVFEHAQELAGENLSATIAQALRRFVEVVEARSRGLDLVTLKVGSKGMYTNKQFMGRELAKQRNHGERQPGVPPRVTTSVVFQTAKGKFVLYVRTSPDWSAWAASWNRDWDADSEWDWDTDWDAHGRGRDRAESRGRPQERGRGRDRRGFDWSGWTSGSEYTMEVYETLDELKPHVSEELYAAAEHASRGEDVEFLDI